MHNGTVQYGLGIPLPLDYAERIERFRTTHLDWASRPMRSDPHISIKGPAGLSEQEDILALLSDIAGQTEPFEIQLTRPTMFEAEPIVYLGIDSPGWWKLHRQLVDTIAARTGAEMHPWEIEGWIPHTTILRLKPELRDRRDEVIAAVERALSPFPCFVAGAFRFYRQDAPDQRWVAVRDFPLSD